MNILFFSPYAFWKLHALYEVALFHHFRHLGHEARYVHCDGRFGECDLYWEATVGPRPACACQVCQQEVGGFLKQYHLPRDPLGTYARDEDAAVAGAFTDGLADADLLSARFDGLPLSAWIKSSVHTHLRVNAFDLANPRHVRSLRAYLRNGVLAVLAVRRLLDEARPDLLVLFNGRMSYPRIAYELARARGVRVVCHERGVARESLGLWENAHCLSLEVHAETARCWGAAPLHPPQVVAAAKWLSDRAKGKNLNWKIYSEQGGLGALGDFLRRHPGKKIAALLTSSTDEIIAYDDYQCAFGDQPTWIDRTVAEFARMDDAVLVIRVHPNSGGKRSTGRNLDELAYYTGLGRRLPSNVWLVMPDEEVSTYALMEGCSIGLIFGTTAALELAGRGKPVLAGARCAWIHCPAVPLVTDPAAYPALLRAALDAPTDEAARIERMRAAFRFIYGYVHRWSRAFPLVAMPDPHTGELRAKTLDDFRPGRHPCLDVVAAIVLGERPLVPSPLPGDVGEVETETAALQEIVAQGGYRSGRAPGVRISVVITCYNYARFLRPCVESIVQQTRPPEEIIIVDDGSTDDSADVARRCIEDFPDAGLRLLSQVNSGQPALARNAGIQLATGDFILPVDADDRLSPGYLAACCEAIEDRPTTELIYADPVYERAGRAEPRVAGEFSLPAMKLGNQLVYCSLYRRDLWVRIGGYRDNIRGYEDWDFWLAAAVLEVRAFHVRAPGLIYNDKDGGVFSQTTSEHPLRVARLMLNNAPAYSPAELVSASRLLVGRGLEAPDLRDQAAAVRYREERVALARGRAQAAWPRIGEPDALPKLVAALGLALRHRDWQLAAGIAARLAESSSAPALTWDALALAEARSMRPAAATAAAARAADWRAAGGAAVAPVPAARLMLARFARGEACSGTELEVGLWALHRLGRGDLAALIAEGWRGKGVDPLLADLVVALGPRGARSAAPSGEPPVDFVFTDEDVAAVAALAAEAALPNADGETVEQLRELAGECSRRLSACPPDLLETVMAAPFGLLWEHLAAATPVAASGSGAALADVLAGRLRGVVPGAEHAWETTPFWAWSAWQRAGLGRPRRAAAKTGGGGDSGSLAGRRVLLYTDDAGHGGAAHYNHNLVLALRSAGAEVAVAQPRADTPMLREQAGAGVRHLWTGHTAETVFPRTMTDEGDAERIFGLFRPELVYFSDSCAVSHLAAKRRALSLGLRYVVICHSEAAYLAERFKAVLPEVALALAGAVEVVAVSDSSRGVLRRCFGLASNRGRVVYNGRPAAYFAEPAPGVRERVRAGWGVGAETLVAFTAARFDSGKGYPLQIEALKRLRELGALDRWRFVWVGEGELFAQTAEAVRAAGLDRHVMLPGYRWDVPELLVGADTFILPSWHEAMPLSIIEAMGRGVPVVATAVGGIPEELGETGRLLPDPNRDSGATSRALADVLAAWAADPGEARRQGAAARARASALFRQERMIEETIAVISSALATRA